MVMVLRMVALPYVLVFSLLITGSMGLWNLTTDITIPTQAKQLTYTLPINGFLNISVFHCFGEFDWYIGADAVPTSSNYSQYIPWAGDTLISGVGWNFTGTLYFLWVCLNTYPGNACATLDLIVNDQATTLSSIFPTPVNSDLKGSLFNNRNSGNVTWTKTDNPTDTYDVYWETAGEGKGDYLSTACAVRTWMNNFTATQGSINDNGDNTETITVINLDPKVPFTVVVVVNRAAGYSSVYNAFILNSGSKLLPSAGVFLCLLAFFCAVRIVLCTYAPFYLFI